MLLSIITVCYNSANVIEKTMQSVIGQSYCDKEYIVVDGYSTDGTIDIINKYKKHIDCFISEPDFGIYNAMNKGIREAKGDYCLFLNAGDIFVNKSVLSNVAPLLTGEAVISGNEIEIRNGKVKDYTKAPPKINFAFFCNNSLRHQSTFIKTDLLKNHMYDETLKIASDWKFWLEQLYINKQSYKSIDVDVCLYSLDGISINDKVGLALQERERIIIETLGDEYVCRYNTNRKRNVIQYIYYRINRKISRMIRLQKNKHCFTKFEDIK